MFEKPEELFARIKANMDAQDDKIRAKLEGLPYKHEELPKEELNEILKLNVVLDEIVKKLVRDIPPENIDARYERFFSVFETLDKLSIWDSKFSTGLTEPRRTDSVYYTTPSGIALRFKMSNLEKDVNTVVQPFMEQIAFYEAGGDHFFPQSMPDIGRRPIEYCSDEFFALQHKRSTDSNFISKVTLYFKDGKLYFMQRPEHMYHEHVGTEINKVFFTKP